MGGKIMTGARSVKSSIAVISAVVVAAVVIIGAIAWILLPSLSTMKRPAGKTPGIQGSTVTGISLTRPVKASLGDLYGDNTTIDGTVDFYSASGTKKDSITVSAGTGTSAKDHTSGESYDVKITPTGFVTMWDTYTVPDAATGEDTTLPLTANVIDLGTFSPKAMEPDGSYLTDTENTLVDNLSKATDSKPAITFEIRNTEDDSGWLTSTDPLLNRDYKCVFYFTLSENEFEDLVVNAPGMGYVSKTTSRTWFCDISDDAITRIVDADGNVIQNGVYQKTVTIDMAGWTTSNTIKCTYGIATYTSADYYQYYQTFGSLSSQTTASFRICQ